MTRRETAIRYGTFIVSLFFSGLGVALAKHGALGVTPISSVPNVLSLRFPALSMGSWLIVWNCLLILGQVAILRRAFQPIQLLQVPLSFLFGWFTDLGLLIAKMIPIPGYWMRLVLVLAGVAVLGFGIAMAVVANVIMNAGEAFVKALADALHKPFGNVKVAFDVVNVLLAVVLSLLFFSFTLVGTREGTVISALLTGVAVKVFVPRIRGPLEKLFQK